MFKMGSRDPFGYLKHKLWPKEGWGVSITKSLELPDLLLCRWCATYHWKYLVEGYNFALDLTLIEGLHEKLWASKVAKISI
jgi:hypothetical protein